MMKKVLIVDDEEIIQEVIQSCLEDLAGWETLLANSGTEGISIAITHQPDAILLDISMPDMDGVETVKQLQLNPETQNIPVILLTAKVQPADRTRFAELSIVGIIAKPFDPMGLGSEVAQLLNWAR